MTFNGYKIYLKTYQTLKKEHYTLKKNLNVVKALTKELNLTRKHYKKFLIKIKN